MTLRLRNGVYQIDITHEDPETGETVRVRTSAKTGDRKLAEAKHAEVVVALHRGTYSKPARNSRRHPISSSASLTVAQAFDRALAGRWMLDASESTRRTALSVYRGMVKTGHVAHNDSVRSFDTHRLEALQVAWRDAGASPSTVNARMWVLKAIFEQALKDSAIRSLPTFPPPLSPPPARKRYITAAEERALLAAAGPDLADFLVLGVDLGGRIGEITGLRVPDLDWHHGLVWFMRTKNGKPRSVPMTDRAKDVLLRRQEAAHGEDLWPVPEGSPRRYWQDRLRDELDAAAKACGIPKVWPHSTRHTYATRLLSSGRVDIRTAMELLGHSQISQTAEYAKVIPESMRTVLGVLNTYGGIVTPHVTQEH